MTEANTDSRRHWPVALAGSTMMLIFWATTPLISSAITNTQMTRSIESSGKTYARLKPLTQQTAQTGMGFETMAYNHIWQGRRLPSFTSREAAFVPFYLTSSKSSGLFDKTWSAITTKYFTTLECEPAKLNRTEYGVSFDNGSGCVTQPGVGIPCADCPVAGLYIGWYTGSFNPWSLSGMGCSSPRYAHTFLIIWGQDWKSSDQNETRITASFCEPKYWAQTANVTVDAGNYTVLSAAPVGDPDPLTREWFNISNFEYIIGTGADAVSPRADIPETTQEINQLDELVNIGWNKSATTTNMLGYTLGLSRLPMQDYMDPSTLHSSFERAHQLLFALSMERILKPGSENMTLTSGTVRGETAALILVRPIAIAAEVSLVLISLAVTALFLKTSTRKSELTSDPASLKSIMRMNGHHNKSWEFGAQALQEDRSSLWLLRQGHFTWRDRRSDPLLRYRRASSQTRTIDVSQQEAKEHGAAHEFVRPTEMGYIVGSIFILTLVMVFLFLVIIRSSISKQGGLPLPSKSSSINQLVLNYIPVAFATFLEPFWTLLNRLLCMLRPLQELIGGNAMAARSLDARYTSLPPQLVLWRALKARHYLLAGVCAMGLASNLLAVSFSGLFEVRSIASEVDITLGAAANGTLVQANSSLIGNHLRAALANFSGETNLDPWVGRDAYFLPFTVGESAVLRNVEAIKGSTRGFSAHLNCSQTELDTNAFIHANISRFFVIKKTPAGRTIKCLLLEDLAQSLPSGSLDSQVNAINALNGPLGGQNNSNSAAEVWRPSMATNRNPEEVEICGRTIVAGFVRANLSLLGNGFKTDNKDTGYPTIPITRVNSLDALWLSCDASIRSAIYDVTVDQKGHMLSYNPVSPMSALSKNQFRNGTSASLLINVTNDLLYPGRTDLAPWWHNDTFVDTWFGYFFKTLAMRTSVIDPSQPPPPFGISARVVEDMYARLFAINLGLHPDWFAEAEPGATARGIAVIRSRRIFMSKPMFLIALVLISCNIIVAILYYTQRPGLFLKQMPTTIAHVLALFDCSGLAHEDTDGNMWRQYYRFGYGKYVGTDGKPHVGIERQPFVVPWKDVREKGEKGAQRAFERFQ